MRTLQLKIAELGLKGTLIKAYSKFISLFYEGGYQNPDPNSEYLLDQSELARIFRENTGNQIHKWHHYFQIYERHLGHLRGTPFKMLEIGVFRGGSLEMWRTYFGAQAEITGIDIDPSCAKFDGLAGTVRIGSQADVDFLRKTVEEMGGIDVVIDDGSHDNLHISKSFDVLFPMLSDGGIYIVEDLHCSYWPSFSGGYSTPWSFINRVKRLVDDMHHWYHHRGQRDAASRDHLGAVHFYDSVIVFEKRRVEAPVCTIRPLDGLRPEDKR